MRRIFLQFILLSIVFFSSSCKKDKPTSFKFEADPAGQWYKGDFHVHATGASNDTGGDSWPEAIKAKAIERNLDFVVLTDHSNSTGSDASTRDEDPALFNKGSEFPYWEKAKTLSGPDKFLMICGNEISPIAEDGKNTATGHIGCIPKTLTNFDTITPFIDRPKGSITGGAALQQALNRGCFTIINHPYNLATWIEYDWTNMNYDAIEIWNGTIGYDFKDQIARRAWICDLLNGKNSTAIGGSDCHRVNTPAPGEGLDAALAYPATAVFAQRLNWNDIMNSLQQGNTYIFEGNSQLLIDTYNKNSKRSKTNFDIIRLRGKADENIENAVLKLIHTTACADARPTTDAPQLTETILFETQIAAGGSFDIRFDITSISGVYTATLLGDGLHYGALSRALVIE